MATTAEITQAVVESLNATAFSRPFLAERAYLPIFDLGEMATLHVTVVAAGRAVQAVSRSQIQVDHRIEVAVQQKLTGEGTADCDPLLDLVGEIADHLSGSRLSTAPEAAWGKTEHAPLIAGEHLTEFRQFTSVLTVTYRTWES